MRRFAVAIVLTVLLAPIVLLASPTAVLVDTSRSIPPSQFEAAKSMLEGLAPTLAEKGPVAIYAFNDAPVEVQSFTRDPEALKSAIGKLKQGGHYTLLYDCLFSAVKAVEGQNSEGVVLLFTDGKDENSAVTLEDAASRAAQAHVAVVAVGMGAQDLKVLRRIAALTGGEYAGPFSGMTSGDVASAWSKVSLALAPVHPPAPPQPHPAAPPQAKPQPPPPPPPASRAWVWVLLLALAAGLAVVAYGVVVLLKRTKLQEARACEQCGRPLNLWEAECPVCLAKRLSITNPGAATQSVAAESVPELDPALLQKGPSSDALEHTLVLDEVPVLVLHRGKNPPRVFQLPPDQVVSVGRDKVNTLCIADQTLSGQHFRIVPKEGTYYLADLQSTNGTFLDGERVTLKELKAGSTIRAGQCEFQFRREQKRLN